MEELNEDEKIRKAIELMNKRITQDEFKIKKIEEVKQSGIWRIYKVVPQKVSKLTEGEIINGQYVDKRIEIDLLEK